MVRTETEQELATSVGLNSSVSQQDLTLQPPMPIEIASLSPIRNQGISSDVLIPLRALSLSDETQTSDARAGSPSSLVISFVSDDESLDQSTASVDAEDISLMPVETAMNNLLGLKERLKTINTRAQRDEIAKGAFDMACGAKKIIDGHKSEIANMKEVEELAGIITQIFEDLQQAIYWSPKVKQGGVTKKITKHVTRAEQEAKKLLEVAKNIEKRSE